MYKRFAGVLFPFLAIALVAVGFWGYQENQEKNSILIKAENQYQRAFHDLNFYVDNLQDELGKSIAVNSRDQLAPCMVNIWRIASNAQYSVGQLPLTLMPFNKTEEFLSKISDFSYHVAIRDLMKEPLSQSEWKTLKSLYAHSNEIQTELSTVQTKVLQNNLRWMDVEMEIASEDKKTDNTIVDGFKTVEKQVEGYSEVDWGKTLSNIEDRKKGKYARLKGEKIDENDAKKKINSFLGLGGTGNIRVEKVGKGIDELEYQSYSAYVSKPNSSSKISIDVTEIGGNVIWMLNDRSITKAKLSNEQALKKAQDFLTKHRVENMEAVNYDTYENMNVYQFVYREDDTLIYPDKATVKVAMDNGEVVGFETADYLFNHRTRDVSGSKFSKEEARKFINTNLTITDTTKAIIADDTGEEVLCYEVEGSLDKNVYRIYVDVNTGREVKVEKLKDASI